jgi:hypothetical protein
VPFRVVQVPKYAEELVGILYIKPHAIIANEQYDLTLGTGAPDPNHRWIVGTRACGVKIGKIEACCFSRDRRTASQGPQKAMFSIKTNEDRPYGTFARGAAGIGYGRQR